ncbi:MAG: DUF423 domain-containing protein [Alphaproteobacteria bacterium]|nr:DUF423 domain-containing protein [Alphaproteobacteria bacterium]
MNIWIVLGGLNAGLAVGLGAYGWHKVQDDVFMMGTQYHMWHALGMIAVGLLASRAANRLLDAAGALFLVGIYLFCGSLYAFGGITVVPVDGLAPWGGTAMMGGWALLALAGGRVARRGG